MRMLVWIMLACAALSPARAADRVEIGPVPAWVRPVAMPAAGPVRGSVSCDQARADADLAASAAIDNEIADEYRYYGMSF
nr:hypothetical protein [Sphingomonas sp. Y57]